MEETRFVNANTTNHTAISHIFKEELAVMPLLTFLFFLEMRSEQQMNNSPHYAFIFLSCFYKVWVAAYTRTEGSRMLSFRPHCAPCDLRSSWNPPMATYWLMVIKTSVTPLSGPRSVTDRKELQVPGALSASAANHIYNFVDWEETIL